MPPSGLFYNSQILINLLFRHVENIQGHYLLITNSRLIIQPYPLFYEGHRFLFNSFIAQQWISYCGEEKTAFAEVCVVECGSLSRNGGGDVIKWLNVSNS